MTPWAKCKAKVPYKRRSSAKTPRKTMGIRKPTKKDQTNFPMAWSLALFSVELPKGLLLQAMLFRWEFTSSSMPHYWNSHFVGKQGWSVSCLFQPVIANGPSCRMVWFPNLAQKLNGTWNHQPESSAPWDVVGVGTSNLCSRFKQPVRYPPPKKKSTTFTKRLVFAVFCSIFGT